MKLDPASISVLKILAEYFRSKGITFVLIGAQVPRLLITAAVAEEHRPTMDVDISLQMQSWADFAVVKRELLEMGFKEDRFELRFLYENSKMDIVPYLEKEMNKGILTLPKTENQLNVTGYDKLFKHAIDQKIDTEFYLPVVPLPLFVFTKILAFLDRGIEKNITKDLEDIVFVFQNYEADGSERRFDPQIPEEMLYEERGAYLIGFDLNKYLSEGEMSFVISFLEYFKDEYSEYIQRIRRFSAERRKEIYRLFRSFTRGCGL